MWNKILSLSEGEIRLPAVYWFKLAVFSWMLLGNVLMFPYRQDIFSDTSFIPIYPNIAEEHFLSNLVFHDFFRGKQIYFYYAQTLAIILGICNFFPRLINILVLFLTINLWNKAWVTMDGGNNLISILMIYMQFMNTSGKALAPVGKWLQPPRILAIVSHNMGFFACVLQTAIVYFTAGYLKADGSLWQNGMALYYILQSETYSSPFIATLIKQYPELSVIGSYFAQMFQLCFPTMVWFKSARPYVLTAGIILHLGIAIAMGLFLFGLAMIVTYVLFLDDDVLPKIKNKRRVESAST